MSTGDAVVGGRQQTATHGLNAERLEVVAADELGAKAFGLFPRIEADAREPVSDGLHHGFSAIPEITKDGIRKAAVRVAVDAIL